MPIQRARRGIAKARLEALARELLDASTLCAIATVSPGGRPHVNTVYFAWSPRLDLIWLSEPGARHSRNVRARRAAAVAIYDSHQTWGRPDRGIQLFGTAEELASRAAADAERAYAERFPEYGETELSAYRLYRLRPRWLKLFDEPALGRGVFVTARVSRGELAWEQTEIYESAA